MTTWREERGVCVYVCVRVSVCVCACAHMRVCVCVCTYIMYVDNMINFHTHCCQSTLFIHKGHHPLGNFVAATLETSKEILMNLIMTMIFMKIPLKFQVLLQLSCLVDGGLYSVYYEENNGFHIMCLGHVPDSANSGTCLRHLRENSPICAISEKRSFVYSLKYNYDKPTIYVIVKMLLIVVESHCEIMHETTVQTYKRPFLGDTAVLVMPCTA